MYAVQKVKKHECTYETMKHRMYIFWHLQDTQVELFRYKRADIPQLAFTNNLYKHDLSFRLLIYLLCDENYIRSSV